MEYVPGGDLRAQHQSVALSAGETIGVLHQSLLGLEHLHSRQIAHRDVKPENILFKSRRPFHVKLADFGLARETIAMRTYCGSQLYIAPEIDNMSRYTSAVDIWSLGVIAFEYAYSLPRYNKRDWPNRLIKAVEDCDSDELIDLLSSSMLRIDPEERKKASDCSQYVVRHFQTAIRLLDKHEPGDFRCTPEASTPTRATEARQSADKRQCPGEAQDSATELCTQLQDPQVNDLQEQNIQRSIDRNSPKRTRYDLTSDLSDSQPFLSRETHGRYSDNTRSFYELGKEVSSSLLRVTVNGHVATLRKTDLWLNATEVLALANLDTWKFRQILDLWRKTAPNEIDETGDCAWVSRRIGRIICETLKLDEALEPLLQYEHTTLIACPETTEFLCIRFGHSSIYLRKRDKLVNAVHIANAAGLDRHTVVTLRKEWPHEIIKGNKRRQGTYIGAQNALRFCEQLRLFHIRDFLYKMLSSQYQDEGDRINAAHSEARAMQGSPTAAESVHQKSVSATVTGSAAPEEVVNRTLFFAGPTRPDWLYLLGSDVSALEKASPKLISRRPEEHEYITVQSSAEAPTAMEPF